MAGEDTSHGTRGGRAPLPPNRYGCVLPAPTVYCRQNPGVFPMCSRGGSRTPLYLQGIPTIFRIQRACDCLRLQVRCWLWEVGCQMFCVEAATCPFTAKSLRNNSTFSTPGNRSSRARIL